jgi:hypothetical protein
MVGCARVAAAVAPETTPDKVAHALAVQAVAVDVP